MSSNAILIMDECLVCGINCSEHSDTFKEYNFKNGTRNPTCYDCEYETTFKKCIKCNKLVHETYWDPFIKHEYHKLSVRSKLNKSDSQYLTMNEIHFLESVMRSRKFCYQCSMKVVKDTFSDIEENFD